MQIRAPAQGLESSANLDDLSASILQQLGRFLDSTDVIALTQVNRKLRESLIHNPVWTDLLNRVGVELLTPFEEVLRRCDSCTLHREGKTVHQLLNLRLCKKCVKSRKFDFVTKKRGMKNYFVNREDFDTLRKVPGAEEGEEDLYLRSDVKELGDAREARLKGAVLGSIFGQIQQQTGGAMVATQVGNSLLVGLNPALL
jgi:hypothetical protein